MVQELWTGSPAPQITGAIHQQATRPLSMFAISLSCCAFSSGRLRLWPNEESPLPQIACGHGFVDAMGRIDAWVPNGKPPHSNARPSATSTRPGTMACQRGSAIPSSDTRRKKAASTT